jgi:hypothetical protein
MGYGMVNDDRLPASSRPPNRTEKSGSVAAYKLLKLVPWCVKTEQLNHELSDLTHLGTYIQATAL